jgi:type IV secretion system protein VirD4
VGLQAAWTTLLFYGAARLWPEADASWFHYIGSALLFGAGAWFGVPASLQVIKYHVQARRKRLAKEAERGARDAGFETEEGLEAAGCFDPNSGVPVGMFNGRPFFYPFTHALVNAPAGTQKTVAAIIPSGVHGFRVRGKKKHESHVASAIFLDLKRELKAMLGRLRNETHGHTVRIVDPADPLTDAYNPLDLVVDCLHGDLPRAKAMTFADVLALALEPEPPNDSRNRFWRAGSRNVICLVILWLCEFHPDGATLSEVCRIVRDPAALEPVINECAGSDAVGGELGVTARDLIAQDKYLAEFRTGAALALKSFSGAGELAAVTGRSTFRWRDCKREAMTVFICANLSESRVFSNWLRLVAECVTLELEFSPGNIPVHLVLDELTNISFDISPKLTALRSAGVRCHMAFQERSEVDRVFGPHARDTIYGEVDLEQYFNFSDLKLAQDVERRLGTVEIVKPSYSTGENPWDAYQKNAGFQRKPLMSAYELMFKMPPTDQIVFIRSRKHALKPIYCQKLPCSAVKEWRDDMLDPNPVEGGKLPGPSTIRMSYTKRGVRVTSYKRQKLEINWERLRRMSAFLPPLWLIWAGGWLWLAYAAWNRLVEFFSG